MIKPDKRSGVAALPTILVISGVISLIAVSAAFVAYLASIALTGSRASIDALAAANSGVEDALLKIVRDRSFTAGTPYTLSVGRASAAITVTSFPTTNTSLIDSVGSVFPGTPMMRQKRAQAKVSIDPTTGETRVISFLEVPL